MDVLQLAQNIVDGEYTQTNDSLRILALEVVRQNIVIEALQNELDELEDYEDDYDDDLDDLDEEFDDDDDDDWYCSCDSCDEDDCDC